MIYPKEFESKVGFDTIRNIIIGSCTSRLSRQKAEEMAFSSDYDSVIHRLRCVSEMKGIIEQSLPYPMAPGHDVAQYITEIKARNSFMSAERMYKLMQMLQAFSEIRLFFDSQKVEEGEAALFPALSAEIEPLSQFPILVSVISSAINKFGEIKDNASPELYEIRQSIKRASGSMQRAMRSVMDSAIAAGIIDKDVSPTMRDGRLVLPVNAGNKRMLNGIVHDESATGKTVFIEPAQVVEAGNRLRELQLEEKREEAAILIAISDQIRPYAEDILVSCDVAATLEFIRAKALFAIDVNANMPNLENASDIEWYGAYHPGLFLSLREHDRKVVPLNLTLDKDKRILIISGPNAGGKSVTLKTAATVQYMTQCGLLPTLYDNSHVGIFNKIFIDIGDEQSFENDLSTYSSHLRNMKYFMSNADKHTLLLADEMGSGTEPQIGGAMAQAILEQLATTGCYGIITTHYQNLKKFADDMPGFINGAMLYDRGRLEPTFQLSVGNAGSSFAIDIAHKMGLPLQVIDAAKRIVGEDYVNFDRYLSDIARDRKYWNSKRQNIREKEARLDNLLSKYEEVAGDLTSKRKEILREAREEAARILAEANARIERTILEIRNAQAEKERTKQLRKDLKEFANQTKEDKDKTTKNLRPINELSRKSRKPKQETSAPAPKQEKKALAIGDYVTLDSGATPGKILSLTGKKAEVAFGALRTTVELKRLKPTKAPKPAALNTMSTISNATASESRARQLNFKTEIDVRGMRADEALQTVTYFIDDAIQFNAGKVRILHGTGHGILKTLIRQQLKVTPGVSSFEDEDIRFGGAGITVVELD